MGGAGGGAVDLIAFAEVLSAPMDEVDKSARKGRSCLSNWANDGGASSTVDDVKMVGAILTDSIEDKDDASVGACDEAAIVRFAQAVSSMRSSGESVSSSSSAVRSA